MVSLKKLLLDMGKVLGLGALLIVAAGLGFLVRGCVSGPDEPGSKAPVVEKAPEVWTCSMHPQIQQPKPGKCPLCGMDLIPVKADAGGDTGPRRFATSEAAKKLMDIETAPVERKFVAADIRLVGKVDYDETRKGYITAWVPGRLDRLFVDYTGVPVRKGDHLVEIYSPELLAAQEELLQSVKAVRGLKDSTLEIVRESAKATLDATREKLRLWGLTKPQIAEIEKRGKGSDHITIYAPMGGIVIHKNAEQGMYVKTGTRIYTIADLSNVWVKLDAYESDLVWVRYGQDVVLTTEAYPGEEFPGRISFIDPILNDKTRTVKVRVNVPNPAGKLKPGMFIRAVVYSTVAAGGRVMDPSLAGKWISPMHPEIVKDKPGKCDVCGMPLVRAEALGFVGAGTQEKDKPLVIPDTAPLLTGKRAVVYVQVPDADRPTFEGREVVLGPRAGRYYIVHSGLAEGERVVTNGSFKIDSALQIQAKPSMMSPEGGGAPHSHAGSGSKTKDVAAKPEVAITAPEAFQRQLGGIWKAYLLVQASLAGDEPKEAARAVGRMEKALSSVDMKLLDGLAHTLWMKEQGDLRQIIRDMTGSQNLKKLREHFAPLSDEMTQIIKTFGIASKSAVYRLRCPMAFNNKGASWLQKGKEVSNPYFGAAMLKCGEVAETLQAAATDKHAGEHGHE